MSHKILRPLSKALEIIISTEELIKEIGLKALADLDTFKKYLKASEKEYLLHELVQKNEGFLVMNDDEFVNDHILCGIKSPLIDNENNILFFLLPAVVQFEEETYKNIEDICVFFTLPNELEDFKKQMDVCIAKCAIIALMHADSMTKKNLN